MCTGTGSLTADTAVGALPVQHKAQSPLKGGREPVALVRPSLCPPVRGSLASDLNSPAGPVPTSPFFQRDCSQLAGRCPRVLFPKGIARNSQAGAHESFFPKGLLPTRRPVPTSPSFQKGLIATPMLGPYQKDGSRFRNAFDVNLTETGAKATFWCTTVQTLLCVIQHLTCLCTQETNAVFCIHCLVSCNRRACN